jgi:hypothetical protein
MLHFTPIKLGMQLRSMDICSLEISRVKYKVICYLSISNLRVIICLRPAYDCVISYYAEAITDFEKFFKETEQNILGCSSTCDTPATPPLPDVLGTCTHTSTAGDTPLDMTTTRGSRPPPSYSQSLASYRNAPARPSVITCAPPASTSWGDQNSDIKGANKDENGRQGHRRELLSGEFILYSNVETERSRHDLVHKYSDNFS